MATPPAPSEIVASVNKLMAFQIGPFKLPALGLAVGGFLLFVCFFLPWWSISYAKPKTDGMTAEQKKTVKVQIDVAERTIGRNISFYGAYGGVYFVARLGGSETLFGWNIGTGIACLIVGFLSIAMGVVPQFVPPIRRFAWIGLVAGAFMAFILLLMSFIFIVRTPGRNVTFLAQGISVGPLLAMLASLIILALGGWAGTIELIRFFKQQNVVSIPLPPEAAIPVPPQPAPPQAPPPPAAPPVAAPPPADPQA